MHPGRDIDGLRHLGQPLLHFVVKRRTSGRQSHRMRGALDQRKADRLFQLLDRD
jgi:hypothetical protein